MSAGCGVNMGYERSESVASSATQVSEDHGGGPLGVPRFVSVQRSPPHKANRVAKILRIVFNAFQIPLHCKWLSLPGGPSRISTLGTRVTGTLFGYRKGHAHFAVQEDPRAPPQFQIELAMPTNTLVKEMSSGLMRIALECEKTSTSSKTKLYQEPMWTMYCNGKITGYALKKNCSETDLRVLGMVQAVSMGAGVLPTDGEHQDDELMYMRAGFDRVAGSKDSEAFYMMNPDGSGGRELSIFLLRI